MSFTETEKRSSEYMFIDKHFINNNNNNIYSYMRFEIEYARK